MPETPGHAAGKQSPIVVLAAALVLALGGGTAGYTLAPSGSAPLATSPTSCPSCDETKREVTRTMAGYDASLDALVKRVAFMERLLATRCSPPGSSPNSSSGVGQ